MLEDNVQVIPPGPPVEAYEQSRSVAPMAPGRSLAEHVNAGTVAVEQARAEAEVMTKIKMAIAFPRNEHAATQKIIRACQELSLAEEAFYEFSRGETVTGPSIRLAEELARCWGNIESGLVELSQKDGVSEMRAYAWDKETNTESVQNFTVRHIRDTKSGGRALSQQRDIYELTANMGSRRLRARILAILPKWYVRLAEDECRKTLRSGDKATVAERSRRMLAEFTRYGVNVAMIEKKIGKPFDQITGDDLVTLRSAFTAIKDGASAVSEVFPSDEANKGGLAAALTAATEAKPDASASKGAKTKAKEQPQKAEGAAQQGDGDVF